MWKFEVFKDDVRAWRWRLVQGNTLIVVESFQSFARRVDAENAAEEARRLIGAAMIEVL